MLVTSMIFLKEISFVVAIGKCEGKKLHTSIKYTTKKRFTFLSLSNLPYDKWSRMSHIINLSVNNHQNKLSNFPQRLCYYQFRCQIKFNDPASYIGFKTDACNQLFRGSQIGELKSFDEWLRVLFRK